PVVFLLDSATTVLSPLSLHDALPIWGFVCSYADPLGPREQRLRERTERRAPSPAHALAAVLDALGVRDGRLGLDEGNLAPAAWRSEEHTSELQSRGHLVCRLLLERKK